MNFGFCAECFAAWKTLKILFAFYFDEDIFIIISIIKLVKQNNYI